MKKIPELLLRCSVLAFVPVAANAAGTYYNPNYSVGQQQRYNSPYYSQRGGNNMQRGYNNGYNGRYNNGAYSSTRYNSQNMRAMNPQQGTQSRQGGAAANNDAARTNKGFFLDAGLGYESAMWQFEMKDSGSLLHFDNINWYVFDVNGGYKFNAGNTPVQIVAGFKYGIQGADSTMSDDDITNGGYVSTVWYDENTGDIIGHQVGHALSVGTASGGSMMGFNVGFGLTDFMKWGNMRVTPSVGYRYLNYKLKTKKNYGMAIDTANCIEVPGSDEIQCNPAVLVHYNNNAIGILWDVEELDNTGFWAIGQGADGVWLGDTYYFEQPGTSHSYEVDWAGPYLAMDMEYSINKNNSINGRVELGLPTYKSTGDQPYRFDWAHPKSVEDKGGFGDAFHLGLGANWRTALTDSVALSVGVTYDYYTVSGADAKTYLNQGYYDNLYNEILSGYESEEVMLGENGNSVAQNIKQLEQDCPGWVCSSSGEIDSFYKSLGVRVGINALF